MSSTKLPAKSREHNEFNQSDWAQILLSDRLSFCADRFGLADMPRHSPPCPGVSYAGYNAAFIGGVGPVRCLCDL